MVNSVLTTKIITRETREKCISGPWASKITHLIVPICLQIETLYNAETKVLCDSNESISVHTNDDKALQSQFL